MTSTDQPPPSPVPAAPSPSHGLLLSRAPFEEVMAWAAKSVVPVVVAPLQGRTVLVPRGRPAVGAPYDDAATLCAARPAPQKLAPTIGCWVIDERAVITVQSGHWRRQVRWVVWDPERGVLRPPGVEIATPQQVVAAAGGGSRPELTSMLAERHHPPARMLTAVLAVLGLPGAELLLDPHAAEDLAGARVHEPDPKEVAYFEDAVKDAVLLRRELGVQG